MTNYFFEAKKPPKTNENKKIPEEWHVLQLCKSLHCLWCEGQLDRPLLSCTPSVTMCCFGWWNWRNLASHRSAAASLVTADVLPGCCTLRLLSVLKAAAARIWQHVGAGGCHYSDAPWHGGSRMDLFLCMSWNLCLVSWKSLVHWIMWISPTVDTFHDVTQLLRASLMIWWCLGRWLAHSSRYRWYKALIFT